MRGPALVLLVWLLVVGPGLDSMPAWSRRLLITLRGRREERGGRGRLKRRVSGSHVETPRGKTVWNGLGGGGGLAGWLASVAAFGPEPTGPPTEAAGPRARGPSTA